MATPFSIDAIIDRFEGDYGVLRTHDGQEIMWPATKIPDDLEEGSAIELAIVSEEMGPAGVSPHDILNEIFSGDEEA